ncbi:family 78 glycoside hydrolase catalytic domain [Nocardioides nitrophenolicus]|uniref:family 78 glycoside hydrolase catalytic domain n=1 Tax=Nocardioides nitrophenolicus TaxID=60489 RepID=UPI00195BABD2|nr:family 78 glycoside hydrolase catalytic domain [Nocardioides nitrophenolicus]MBM7519369.1 alpha-L-rhamnosidase [Nocardioides nitrophenolicus]
MTRLPERGRKAAPSLAAALGLALTLGTTGAVATPATAAPEKVATSAATASVAITGLEVNHLTDDPLGIDDPAPVLCWGMESNLVGAKQVSYRIEVARDARFTSLAWDSGVVASDESTDIRYGSTGDAAKLRPETDYWWRVRVVDNRGVETVSDVARFSTGLMDTKIGAWDGAQWIGSTKTKLDAKSLSIFDVNAGFTINAGDNASFIFGADDQRFTSDFRNVYGGPGGENFVRFELDLSGVTSDPATNTGGVVNLYRKGYHATDDVNGDPNTAPYKSVRLVDSTNAAVRTLFTPANKNAPHTLRIQGNESAMTYTVDGVALTGFTAATLTLGAGRPGALNNLNVSPNSTIDGAGTHTMVTGGNYNTFPNLNSVGFSVKNVGDDVTITDYRIVDVGQSAKRTLFDATTGANYGIFTSLPNAGITATGNTIRINPTTPAQVGPRYADPSYGAQTQLRSEFRVDPAKDIAKARLYVTAQGAYEMHINGERVSDDYLNPGMATYAKTLPYQTYDVTDLLANGTNAVGAMLGPGFWSGMMTFTGSNYNMFGDSEALLARMVITFADGSTQTVVTNPTTWKAFNDGPNRYADNFQGVRYDAGKEANVANWTTTSYKPALLSKWSTPDVITMKSQLNPALVSRQDQPVHEVERLTAKRVLQTHSEDDTTWTYDMGVNMVGVPTITIPKGSLRAGDEVIFRFGETIYPGNSDSPNTTWPGPDPRVSQPTPYADLYGPDGSYRPGVAGRILTDTYRGALASDTYVASAADADRDVVITPNFTFRGYQYIEITVPHRTTALPLDGVQGIVLSSIDLPESDYEATTSDDNYTGRLATKFFDNAQRSQLGNFFSLPTDCPQRNERMGWTGDLQAYARSATYNSSDTQAFLRQWMVALRDAQGSNGSVGTTVPVISLTGELGAAMPATPTWEGAVAQAPWQLYTQYGDTQIIEENFATIQKWLKGYSDQPLSADYPGLTAGTSSHADHISMDANTEAHMVNQAMYLYFLDISAKMADIIGRTAYAETLRQRYTQGVDSFNRLYVDPQTGFTLNATPGANLVAGRTLQDSQASYATPLALDLFSDTMTVQAGPDAGKTYREFATERLAELIADPAKSNDGNGPKAGTGIFSGGQASNKPYTITTGFNATPNILPALTKTGEIETAYKLFSNDEFASWLYPVTLGATSMWELWNSYERGFAQGGNSQMNSQNHFALGASQQWMYEYQLGITSDGGKGYREFVLQPVPGGDFTSVEGSFDSSYGVIDSHWEATDGELTSYATTVPANTTATLYLPVQEEVTSFENIPGVSFVGMTERNGLDTAEFRVAAGGYDFEVDGGTVTAEVDGAWVVDDTVAVTSVTAPAVTGTYGQPSVVVATVTGEAPTGTVTVTHGTTPVGSGTVVDGAARITLGALRLEAGTHQLGLRYAGDDANAASAGSVGVTVAQATTSLSAKVRPKRPKAGTRPKVVVRLSADGAVPTGVVKVRSGGKVIGTGKVDATGKVVIRLTRQPAGVRTIRVVHAGSRNFTAARTALRLTVRR